MSGSCVRGVHQAACRPTFDGFFISECWRGATDANLAVRSSSLQDSPHLHDFLLQGTSCHPAAFSSGRRVDVQLSTRAAHLPCMLIHHCRSVAGKCTLVLLLLCLHSLSILCAWASRARRSLDCTLHDACTLRCLWPISYKTLNAPPPTPVQVLAHSPTLSYPRLDLTFNVRHGLSRIR